MTLENPQKGILDARGTVWEADSSGGGEAFVAQGRTYSYRANASPGSNQVETSQDHRGQDRLRIVPSPKLSPRHNAVQCDRSSTLRWPNQLLTYHGSSTSVPVAVVPSRLCELQLSKLSDGLSHRSSTMTVRSPETWQGEFIQVYYLDGITARRVQSESALDSPDVHHNCHRTCSAHIPEPQL